jgi:hypothetical protein
LLTFTKCFDTIAIEKTQTWYVTHIQSLFPQAPYSN